MMTSNIIKLYVDIPPPKKKNTLGSRPKRKPLAQSARGLRAQSDHGEVRRESVELKGWAPYGNLPSTGGLNGGFIGVKNG
jgi:hypothetical protein